MASDNQETSRATHMQYYTDDDDSENGGGGGGEEEEEDEGEEESTRDCRNTLFMCGAGLVPKRSGGWSLGQVLDPRAKWVQEWNRGFLLVCATGLFVDPLFFYALSVSDTCMCLFIDGWFALTVTALRCMTDALHVWNMWLQLKMAKKPSIGGGIGGDYGDRSGPRFSSPSSVALRYLKAKKGFFFDLFVILPLPQIILWVAIPSLLEGGSVTVVMTIFLIIFLFQYLPKIYHSVCLLRRMQNLSGYIFGTVWWGIALNMIAYFVASHAAGACWYLLGIQRTAKCLKEKCRETQGCGLRLLSCKEPIYYGTASKVRDGARLAWADNKVARATCLDSSDNYDYGAYKWTVQLVTNGSRLEKILFPIFWGLMTLSTFGNLESTTEWLEVVFNIIVLTSGLLLVTMLIGNIKVFLHATTSKKQAMQLKMRNIEWWMRKRRLPPEFRHRVRNYERQRWAAMRGVDECEMIRNLPEGLRRDIKYHLCLDLVRQVPLFQHMDDLVLENICDRVKSLIFTKGETITREGDPVQRMLFVVRGHLQSSQVLRDGVKSCCMLGPGNFSGDELLSWCLRRPFIERLPPSSCTLVTLETTEAFGLEAEDVKYVTQHFRYTFVNERVKRSARYYSPGWRTWAAVAIQLAWRRYKHRLTLTSLSFIRPRRPLSRCSSLGEDRLRLYTALLTSPKPNQEDFDF
ncbi:cyclic nucleotide-gated ion channel 4 [Ricinus communis]|uniref:Cyclic nucleotide-gated ion channel, putative n=1 Tax=Ricinus communis TaxID=3988 RepID=B9SIE1_RICCO|nr:cyclic nucleotide-gated ion channel 4 [Ricinus communis]EEF36596.1 Cyclic nucleotide-gated ion channel, putative [Ricinus communis]URX64888.1 cyclic nucleotide gated channel 4 [Ricinus communis]|eukprot:XP_002525760.1 cyclic nucleotide-gated ion channel 4 [Ricinus communis]